MKVGSRYEFQMRKLQEEREEYKKYCMQAVLKGDKKQRSYWANKKQQCTNLSVENGKLARELMKILHELKKQLFNFEHKKFDYQSPNYHLIYRHKIYKPSSKIADKSLIKLLLSPQLNSLSLQMLFVPRNVDSEDEIRQRIRYKLI